MRFKKRFSPFLSNPSGARCAMGSSKHSNARRRPRPKSAPTGAGDVALLPRIDDVPRSRARSPPCSPRPFHPGARYQLKWRMALYIRQPFPDNHVPDSFLDKLVTNGGVSRPKLIPIFLGATAVTQQISVVVIFLMAFVYSYRKSLSLPLVLATDAVLLVGGYSLAACVHPRRMLCFHTLLSTILWVSLCAACLRIVAPVLRTLTVSYSDDTIYALALLLSGLHLVFYDYGAAWPSQSSSSPSGLSADSSLDLNVSEGGGIGASVNGNRPNLPEAGAARDEPGAAAALLASPAHFHGTFSLNAAFFAAVLLASRLESNEEVFGFVFLAIQLFAFFPLGHHLARRRSMTLHLLVALGLVATATCALAMAPEHRSLLVMYLMGVGFVSFVCPVWLQHIHKYKFTIQGPWDVASVEGAGGEDF